MSAFKPHDTMPAHLMALRSAVTASTGLHMTFPYGTLLPKPGKPVLSTLIPETQFVGLTVRGFYYAPEISTTKSEIELLARPSFGTRYWALGSIEGTRVRFEFKGTSTLISGNYYVDATVTVPGYYSLAVRLEDKKNVAAYCDENQVAIIKMDPSFVLPWQLRLQGAVHYILSLHVSGEADTAPRKLGQEFFMQYPEFGIGSYWLMDVYVENAKQPLTVNLWGYSGKKDQAKKKILKSTSFSVTQLKPGDVATIHIRSTRGGFLVTTSFDDSVNFITTSAETENLIYPGVSQNCQILTQYAEQGPERWQ